MLAEIFIVDFRKRGGSRQKVELRLDDFCGLWVKSIQFLVQGQLEADGLTVDLGVLWVQSCCC